MSVRGGRREKIAEEPTMIGFLCGTQARRTLLEYLLTEIAAENTDERMTGDIMDDAGLSRNSVTSHLELFVQIGLVTTSEGNKFTWYTPTAGSAWELLTDLNQILATEGEHDDEHTALTTLYGSDSRRILTDFFVYLGLDHSEDDTDPSTEPLTKKELYEESGVTRKTIISEIDTLVTYGIVEEDTTHSYPRYYPAINSIPFRTLVETNDSLIRAFESNL